MDRPQGSRRGKSRKEAKMKCSYLLLTAIAMVLLTSAVLGGWFGKPRPLSRGPRQVVSVANAASWHHHSAPRYASSFHHYLRSGQ
jgi:hypothetical protein